MKRAKSLYTALLHCYPAPFRQEYGHQMSVMFAEQLREARRTHRWRNEAALWTQTIGDLLTVAPREHCNVIIHDLRLTLRGIAAKPAFAFIAILSLALGIGANAAIFGLWNGVLFASLPGVHDPSSLVILTQPSATGMWRGQWNPRGDGPRDWVTYAEFELIRDHVPSFAAVIATESSLSTWQARFDGGAPEEVRGRLVSGQFFEVLGVRPAIGQLFTRADDESERPRAVLSHAYWQRRFGGAPEVLGKTIAIRGTPITIVGVAAAGFIGETSGQSPDVWFPIRLQPRILSGGDWLTERPPDKVMWLHLFARLRPGTTEAQAEAQTNAIFQAFQKSSSGSTGDSSAPQDRLQLQAARRGASPTRGGFATSLTMLLASSGILLLIACANLANLLLARSGARQGEIAVRVSLGASRGRIVRQLATEGLTIAALGGVAALVVASILHRFLVKLLQESEPLFALSFTIDTSLMLFAFAITAAAGLLVGLLPAWLMSTADPGSYLKDHSRGTVGSSRELRSARLLVAFQIALSLPLLVAAGLLAQTVYHLQRPPLGFEPEGLLLARVDLGDLAQDVRRRDRLLRELRERFQRIPGVVAVTFSQIGLYTGSFSTASIEVEGSAVTANQPVDSELDRLGTNYFATLRVPLTRGRDIADSDRADSRLVCVINEAFAQRYFEGRNPIGLHVTTIDGSERRAYEVVGVSGDARTRSLRDPAEPRFFVPAEQRPSSGTNRTFIIRASSASPTVVGSVRTAASEVDAALSVAEVASIEDQIAPLTAEERALARLAIVFGITALALAAIGLYGVLSYGISRRSAEIAIRIALGAKASWVVRMILRESLRLVVFGVVAGGVLAVYAPRIIATRLYGVAPDDPLTFVVAILALLLVAMGSIYGPARRASRVDPMIALHQG